MRASDRLYAWARPEGILLPEEGVRLGEFLDLFGEQLALVARNPSRPTVVERIAARSRAAKVWAYARLADDAEIIRTRIRNAPARQLARGEQFAELDLKSRAAHLLFEQLADDDRLLALARDAVEIVVPGEENVVRMRKSK